MDSRAKKIFILAGEASGDLLGGRLMVALRMLSPAPIEFVGVGGETMISAGLNPLFPMKDLSHMGLFEVIKHLPKILKRHREVVDYITQNQPELVITIDSPDTSFRIAKKIRHLKIPHVHYTPPTVWAWRAGRAKKIAKLVDHLLCILPFEAPYFEKYGLDCTFVGHMITELGIESIPRETFRETYDIAPETPLLCLLPGSRVGEIERLLPIFKQAVVRLAKLHPHLRVVIPVAENVKELVMAQLDDFPLPSITVSGQRLRYAAMRACNVALAASGTVNLELSMAQVPFVIGYKMNALTGWLAPKVVKVPYMTMTNIILDKPAVPEFFQNDCTQENLFLALNKFLIDRQAREQVLIDQRRATLLLKPAAGMPSEIAARTVLNILNASHGS